MKPFLRRLGGKTRVLPVLRPLVPEFTGRFVSPFLGGGALELDLLGRNPALRSRATLADADAELVSCYLGVQTDPEGVAAALQRQQWGRESFLPLRDMSAEQIAVLSIAEQAARVLAVNVQSFNGLARRNQQGERNEAFAEFNPRRLRALLQRIRMASRVLQGVELDACDFEPVINMAGGDDFCFADAPYDQTFTGYTAGGFGDADQQRLAAALRAFADRGGKFLATNAHTELVRELYTGCTFRVIPVRYNVSGDASARKAAQEVAITSFAPVARLYSVPSIPAANMTGGVASETRSKPRIEGGMVRPGKRLNDAAVQTRCEFVQELLRVGMARAEILKAFRVQFGDVSTRAVDGYLRRAKERWQIEAIAAPSLPAARTQEREAFLAKLDQDVAVFVAAGVLAPITRLRTLEAEVRGLRILRPQEPPVAPPQPPGATTNILNLTLGRSPEDLAHETRLLKRVIAMREGTAQPDPDLDAIEAEGTSLESDRSAE